MILTMAEAINLILGFYTTPAGFWADIDYSIPELSRFIDAGMTCNNVDNDGLLIPNEEGKQVLVSYFNEISNDFIMFMRTQGMECPMNQVEDWFLSKYDLPDRETGEEICKLIASKASQFGYIALLPHSSRKQDKIVLQKK